MQMLQLENKIAQIFKGTHLMQYNVDATSTNDLDKMEFRIEALQLDFEFKRQWCIEKTERITAMKKQFGLWELRDIGWDIGENSSTMNLTFLRSKP